MSEELVDHVYRVTITLPADGIAVGPSEKQLENVIYQGVAEIETEAAVHVEAADE